MFSREKTKGKKDRGVHHASFFRRGLLKCWGKGSFNRLGYGDQRDRSGTGTVAQECPFVDLGADMQAKDTLLSDF